MKYTITRCLFFILIMSSAFSQTQKSGSSFNPSKNLHPPPVPYFIIKGLCYGDTTYFINKTTSTIISSEWSIMNDKGDTIYTSKNQDASYYFKKRGFYSICLAANNGHIASKIRTVRIDTITTANFAFRYCYDEFENLSTCSDQFVWILPDNSTSTDFAPAYTFTVPGKFPVKLEARKGNKSNTLSKLVNMRGDSIGLPNAAFTCKRIDTSSTFEFTAVDSLATLYSWYFGDQQGDDTSGYKVIHTIDKSKYTPPVNLLITNGCGFTFDFLDPFTVTVLPEETKSMMDVTVYPNPVEEELIIAVNNSMDHKKAVLRLMDINGAIVTETKLQPTNGRFNFKYDVTQLHKGIYLLQVEVGKQVVNRKIMVH